MTVPYTYEFDLKNDFFFLSLHFGFDGYSWLLFVGCTQCTVSTQRMQTISTNMRAYNIITCTVDVEVEVEVECHYIDMKSLRHNLQMRHCCGISHYGECADQFKLFTRDVGQLIFYWEPIEHSHTETPPTRKTERKTAAFVSHCSNCVASALSHSSHHQNVINKIIINCSLLGANANLTANAFIAPPLISHST